MPSSLIGFETFRNGDTPPVLSQSLRQRITGLQREIKLTQQRQHQLKRANQTLTRLIVSHNNQHHSNSFLARISSGGTQTGEYPSRSRRSKQGRREGLGRQGEERGRQRQGRDRAMHIHTQESNDQNDYSALNCAPAMFSRQPSSHKMRTTYK